MKIEVKFDGNIWCSLLYEINRPNKFIFEIRYILGKWLKEW